MSFSDLPTELIVHVFKSVDSISSAAALSQTSHHLHQIWRHNLPSICDAVLPRVIECYDQARQLLQAMTKLELVVDQSSVKEKYDAAVIRARLLIINDSIAHGALKSFASSLPTQWDEPLDSCTCVWNGTGHDDDGSAIVIGLRHNHFLEGYYRCLSMIYLVGRSATRRYQFLASMNLVEFFRMFEMVEYIFFDFRRGHVPNKDRYLPGYDSWPLDTRDDEGYLDKFVDCIEFLDLFESYIHMSSDVERPMIKLFCAARTSYRLVLLDDCLSNEIKKAESIALAHILPQLPNDILFDPRFELFTSH